MSAPAFPTGRGQADTHAVVLSDGRQNPHPSAGQPYDTITGGEIVTLMRNPPRTPKAESRWFIPSSYREADAREHAVQRERGTYWWLTGDIDHGDLPLADVQVALGAVVPGTTTLIYSTRSAKPGDRRWRVLVPLAEPLAGIDYHDTQCAFFDLLTEASGGALVADRALARPAQLVYLPTRGEHYELHAVKTGRLSLGSEHSIIARREATRAADERARREAAAERAERAARRKGNGADAGSPVDRFNAAHTVEQLLERYGYTTDGGSDWASPHQTSGSFATRDFGDYWVSLSGSDAAAGIGRETASGYRTGDAFDLFACYEHGGDFEAAVAAYAEETNNFPFSFGPRGCGKADEAEAEGAKKPNGPGPASSAGAESGAGVTLDDFVAYMPTHGYIFTPCREQWPAASVNARVPPVLGPDGKAISASTWLDRNRAVEQATWSPGEPMRIEGRLISDGGWFKRPGCTTLNLYRPPTLKPRPGPVDHWLDHIRTLFPDEVDHIVRWLAQRVQRPDVKINHALVLGGSQGIGKDSILEPVKRAIGPWNFAEVSPQHMLGRFNGFLKSVIIRISEARDLGDLDRYAFYDHMKAYTAAPPDVLRVDEKCLREYCIPNVCGLVITSNHKADGIYLPPDDRRHFVAWSDRTESDFEAGYWQRLYIWFDNGGAEAVAAYLHALPLADFDPKALPAKTPAFWEIVNASRAPENAEMADALDKLGRPEAVTLVSVSNAADAPFAEWLRDRKNARKVPHRMEECGYLPVRNPDADDGLWSINKRRQVVYSKRDFTPQNRHRAADSLAQSGR